MPINLSRRLRIGQVTEKCGGVDVTTIYRWIKFRQFPSPLQLGRRLALWDESQIDDWIKKVSTEAEPYSNSYQGGKEAALQKRYGITLDYFNELKKIQNNCCALCECEFTKSNPPHIDHCHSSNKVRGLLCRSCNIALGFLKDNIDTIRNAIPYLEKAKAVDLPRIATSSVVEA